MHNATYRFLDFILVLLLILLTANPYMAANKLFFLAPLFIIILVRIRGNLTHLYKINWKHSLIILFVFGYELTHAIEFDNWKIWNIFRITVEIYLVYLLIKIINIRFIKIYCDIIFYLAIISLVLYPLMYTAAGPIMMNYAENTFVMSVSKLNYRAPTLIFYSFDWGFMSGASKLYRNAGFTWEAGAFAIYLNIALVFKLFLDKTNKSLLNKYSIIYIAGIISTYSTTGYIVFFFILLIYLLNYEKNIILKWSFILLFLPLSYLIYSSATFLQDKITTQYNVAANSKSQNRFGSAILDINDVMKRPLLGWSRDAKILFGKEITYEAHRPNGITNLLRSYGFIYFIIFFTLLYFSFYKLGKISTMKRAPLFSMYFIMVLLLSAFSQLVFDKLFFRSMVFWGDFMFLASFPKGKFRLLGRNINSHFRIIRRL